MIKIYYKKISFNELEVNKMKKTVVRVISGIMAALMALGVIAMIFAGM